MFLLLDVLILVPDLGFFIGEGLLPGWLDKAEELVLLFFVLSETEEVAFGEHFDASEDCSCYFHWVKFYQLIMLMFFIKGILYKFNTGISVRLLFLLIRELYYFLNSDGDQ